MSIIFLKQSVAATVPLGPFIDDTDGKTTEEALVIAQADIHLSKNGGASAQKSDTSNATHIYSGNYGAPLNTTDTGTLGFMRVMCKEAGALPVKQDCMVIPAAVYDALFAGTDTLQADVTQWLGVAVATPTVSGVPEVDVTHLGGAAQSATDLKDFADAGYDPATNHITGIGGTKNTLDDLNDIAATAIVSAGAITTLSGAVVNVDLVDTCTTNTDMRGTENAALASVCTEARLTQLDASNMPLDLTNIEADTQDIQTTIGTPAGVSLSADIDAIPTALENADAIWDEDIAGHSNVGTFGESSQVNAYSGPYGPGIYIDGLSANTNTITGEDGTVGKPVSNLSSAFTLAAVLGVARYYILRATSELDIPNAHEYFHFVGLGDRDSVVLNLNSQDVDFAFFENVTLQGLQGGTSRATAKDCTLKSRAVSGTTLRVHAINCGLLSEDPGIVLTNNDDHIFDACYSMVPGNSTPMLDASNGANVGINMRHYSGGIELKGLSGTSTTSIETDGQVVFNATNTATAPVTIRGNCSVVDNATMTNITETARIDTVQINDQVTDVLKVDTIADLSAGAPPATPTFEEAVMYLFSALRNRLDVDTAGTPDYKEFYNNVGTLIWKKEISDAGGVYTETEGITG